MTQKKQTQHITGAVLTQEIPEQDRSLIIGKAELCRLYPNAKPEHIDLALKRMQQCGCPDVENEIDYFGKVLAAVIIDETIGKRGGKYEHP